MPLFALALVAFVGLLGLVVDGGTLYVQRRTAQNSADAAVLAGARRLQGASATTAPSVVGQAICTYAQANAFGVTPTITAAYFVGTDGTTSQGNVPLPCTGAGGVAVIPSSASGVHVDVRIPFNTYLVGMLGVSNLNADGHATAQVGQLTTFDAGSAPFLVCGINTRLATQSLLGSLLGSVLGTQSILAMSGGAPATPYRLDPLAVGRTFQIHGPSVADCGVNSNSFKGLADEAANASISTLPADLAYTTGTVAGPTRVRVNGLDGCVPPNNSNCVLLLPVARGTGASGTLNAVLWAAFRVAQISANEHTGTLLSNYLLAEGPRSYTWTYGSVGSVLTIGLTQ